MQRSSRIKKELQMNEKSPTPGISFWFADDNSVNEIKANITGPSSSPYEGGIFKLNIVIPERYPFVPPSVNFETKVYHPNIDTAGRICLDLLKIPPKGIWKPNLNLGLVLKSIRLLLSEPNPDDPLMSEIASEYSQNHELFKKNAAEYTKKYAKM